MSTLLERHIEMVRGYAKRVRRAHIETVRKNAKRAQARRGHGPGAGK